jgi:hypothetical protein
LLSFSRSSPFLVEYAHARIPVASGHAFEMMLLAFLVLLAANIFHEI